MSVSHLYFQSSARSTGDSTVFSTIPQFPVTQTSQIDVLKKYVYPVEHSWTTSISSDISPDAECSHVEPRSSRHCPSDLRAVISSPYPTTTYTRPVQIHQQLPTEIVMLIMACLVSKQDLLRCMTVNYQFYLCAHKEYWRTPHFNCISKWIKLLHVLISSKENSLISYNVDKLNFSVVPVMGDRSQRIAITDIAHWCPNATNLNLYRCEWIEDMHMKLIAQSCTFLRIVNLSYCVQVSDDTVKTLTKQCPVIESLVLRQCVRVGDASLEAIAKSGWKYLRRLNFARCARISNCGLSWAVYRSKINCSVVESIAPYRSTNSGPQFFISMHHPKTLDCQKDKDMSQEEIAQTTGGANALHQLTQLILTNCPLVTDAGLVNISQGCKNLRRLSIAGMTLITSDGVAAITSECNHLAMLDISGCQKIQREWLESLYPHPRIRILHEMIIDLERSSTQRPHCSFNGMTGHSGHSYQQSEMNIDLHTPLIGESPREK
ncbi:hypothetical protein BSLG_010578 [Batrachochytrium salamandrivorans]|nr:hypothetical protein BASA60_009333 [Batrachochytrium salamandrivorans]KAJ1327236.1 hypothetical protein BSLG_010578 [Batrachochytrium salamandrivorans]